MDTNKVGVILFIIIQIPSFCCAIHIFFRFFHRANPLRRLQNNLLVYLLIIAMWTITIDLPQTQIYFWSGSVTIQTSWFCYFWNTSYLSTSALNRILMAFLSIERHFLVFRPQLYRTRRSRLLFHYIPLIFIISIILIYLFITNIFISCPEISFIYSFFMCGYTCTILIPDLGTIYNWVYIFVPTTITTIGCILLPIRFVIQKRQLQRVQWHRARKLIVQTTTIAGAYIACWLPYTIVLQLILNRVLSYFDPNVGRFLAFVPYITSLLTPFIVFHTIREPVHVTILERIKRYFFPQHQTVVQPVANCIA